MKIQFTKRFTRSYKKLDQPFQESIKQAISQLHLDFSHPSLRVKKMQGYRNPNVWEASANMNLGITFEIEKPDTLVFRNCGHHDDTLNSP
ncbi:MAG: type II toxin-antitoxin system YafQ family toxin [Bacillota bacterium]